MADEKILDSEILDDDELDRVAGGTYGETFADMDYITEKTGIQFHGSDSKKREKLRELLWNAGIKLKDHGGGHANEYIVIDRSNGNKLYETNREDALRYAVANIINHT